ncbi:hypothetical protein B0H19DRAFT_1081257 [Mycena capillaripes]|nr:hypothetical protein B0H19DRAFT_1081257 [Mycena capillaripes]
MHHRIYMHRWGIEPLSAADGGRKQVNCLGRWTVHYQCFLFISSDISAGEPSSTGAFLSLPTRLDLTSQHVSGESGAVGNGGRDLGVGYFSSSQQEKPVFLVLTEIKLN